MGRGGAIVLALLVAGCGQATTATPRANETPRYESRPGGVEVPAREPVDNGAAVSVRRREKPYDDGESSYTERPVTAPHPVGLDVTLDSCTMVAPRHWVFRGTVRRPAARSRVEARLSFGFGHGDVGRDGSYFDVVFGDDGAYAVESVVPRRESTELIPRPDSCLLEVLRSETPVTEDSRYPGVEPVTSGERLDYRAPEGTVQALGIGATLRFGDPVLAWAYRAWDGASLPFETVWAPDPAAGLEVHGADGSWDEHSYCRHVLTGAAGVKIVQQDACPPPLYEKQRVEVGRPTEGFVLYEQHPLFVAERVEGRQRLFVEGADRAAVEKVTRSLRPYRNTVVSEHPGGGWADPDLDTAIRNALSRDRQTERDRLPWQDGLYVIGVRDDGPTKFVGTWFARKEERGWVLSGGGGSGWVSCLVATSSEVLLVMAENPAHGLQQRQPDGSWRTLPTTRGIHLGPPRPDLPRHRAIDPATGKVACDQP